MHSFEVHSNESACRKSGSLGLEQVQGCTEIYLRSLFERGDVVSVYYWWERDGHVGEGVWECNPSWRVDTLNVGSPNLDRFPKNWCWTNLC